MRGTSGSGKSTYIRTHFPLATVVSADHFFMRDGEYRFDASKLGEAHGQCLREFVNYLLQRLEPNPLVVDNTNTTTTELAPYAALALAYKYDLEVVTLECDPEVAAARNTHGVPLASVRRMAENITRSQSHIPKYWNPSVVKA